MDLPALNNLEKIYPNTDKGYEAIRKLVGNDNKIVQAIQEAQLIPGPTGPAGQQGAPGNTPYIGENGNWWIGTTDTGVSASGAQDLTNIQNQINVLNGKVEKTTFSLIAGADYSVVSQNCYIEDGKTYVQAIIKRTDEAVFGTGALYVAGSNILPPGTYPCNAIGFSAFPLNGAINAFIQTSIRDKNILVINTLTNLKLISFICVCN